MLLACSLGRASPFTPSISPAADAAAIAEEEEGERIGESFSAKFDWRLKAGIREEEGRDDRGGRG